jgi:hypothetical protein
MRGNGLYPRVEPLWVLQVVLLELPTTATRIVDCRYRAQNGMKRAKLDKRTPERRRSYSTLVGYGVPGVLRFLHEAPYRCW